MVETRTLMEQDGNSPVLSWTTKLLSTKHADGSLSFWVVEESVIGQVKHTVASNIHNAKKLIPALISISDWCDLRINYDVIAEQISPLVAFFDVDFADTLKREAMLLSLQRRKNATAA